MSKLLPEEGGRIQSPKCCVLSKKNRMMDNVQKHINCRRCKTIILPMVLYGCETRSLSLKEEHRLKVFENKVLRILGLMRDEVLGWRKLHSEELHST
jgi:hypothetical protein